MEIDLPTHEAHSEARADRIEHAIHHLGKGHSMEHGIHDKVEVKNIFEPGKHGGGMDASWAAILPALAAEGRRGGSDGMGFGGLGSGFLGGVLGGLLFNRRGGGLLGDGDGAGSGQATSDFINLQTLGNIQRDIATSANETQAVVNAVGANGIQNTLQQTIALQNIASQSQLANQAGFAMTKDAVQTSGVVNLQATNNVGTQVQAVGCQIERAVANDGEKTRALLTSRFQLEDATRINELNARVIELQNENRRTSSEAGIRIENINNNANTNLQLQMQQQQQQQIFETLRALTTGLINVEQIARATNSNVIVGNTGATTTGAQTASPVNVR